MVLISSAIVPKGTQVVDLSVFVENQDNEPIIVLNSDNGFIHEQLEVEDMNLNMQAIEAEDIDLDVQEWLATQKTSKVNYEAAFPRHMGNKVTLDRVCERT